MNEWANLLEDAVKINEKLKEKDLTENSIELIEDSVDELFLNLNENEELLFETLNKLKDVKVKKVSIDFAKQKILEKYKKIMPDNLMYEHLFMSCSEVERQKDLILLYKASDADIKKYLNAISILPKNIKSYISDNGFNTHKGIKSLEGKIEKQISSEKIKMFFFIIIYIYIFGSFFYYIPTQEDYFIWRFLF